MSNFDDQLAAASMALQRVASAHMLRVAEEQRRADEADKLAAMRGMELTETRDALELARASLGDLRGQLDQRDEHIQLLERENLRLERELEARGEPPVDEPDPPVELVDYDGPTPLRLTDNGQVVERLRIGGRGILGDGYRRDVTIKDVEVTGITDAIMVTGWDGRQAAGIDHLVIERAKCRAPNYGLYLERGKRPHFIYLDVAGGLHGVRVPNADGLVMGDGTISGSVHGSIIRLSDCTDVMISRTRFTSPDGGTVQIGVFGSPTSVARGNGKATLREIDAAGVRVIIDRGARFTTIEGGKIGILEVRAGVEVTIRGEAQIGEIVGAGRVVRE